MLITTFLEKMASWWRDRGWKVELAFSADGIDYWNISVENDDKELTNPEYIDLVIEETRQYPEVVSKRFSPTLHTVTVGNMVASTPDGEGEMSIPLCRSIKLLRSIFTRPDKGQNPKYKDLKRYKQILNTLKRVQGSGVHKVSYYVTDAIVESFKIDGVIRALEGQWKNYITK